MISKKILLISFFIFLVFLSGCTSKSKKEVFLKIDQKYLDNLNIPHSYKVNHFSYSNDLGRKLKISYVIRDGHPIFCNGKYYKMNLEENCNISKLENKEYMQVINYLTMEDIVNEVKSMNVLFSVKDNLSCFFGFYDKDKVVANGNEILSVVCFNKNNRITHYLKESKLNSP